MRWYRYEHRDSLAPDSADDFARLEHILEDHRTAHELRQKYSQELSEHVAQGQQAQEANGMDQALILQISLDFPLERRDIAEHVAVRDHYAFRFGGGSGSKNNFQDIRGVDPRRVVRCRCVDLQYLP